MDDNLNNSSNNQEMYNYLVEKGFNKDKLILEVLVQK